MQRLHSFEDIPLGMGLLVVLFKLAALPGLWSLCELASYLLSTISF